MTLPSRSGNVCSLRALLVFAFSAALLIAGCNSGPSQVAPAISSASSTAFTLGVAGTFTVTATGSPAPTLAESGTLPSGVTFNATTGVLSGTPAAGTTGTYTITITASNGVGTAATQTLTLTVVAAPAITSFTAAKTTITAGTSTTLTAVFTGGTGSVNSSVGAVTSGTAVTVSPAATTTYTLTVTNTANTSVTSTVTVTVVPAPSISSFTAAKTTITAGTSTTLTAVFVGTGSIDNSIGAVTSNTAVNISPAATTTYTLSVTNAAGATAVTATVTVTVVPPPAITSFVSGAPSITAGTSTTLTAAFSGGTGSVNNGVGAVTTGTAVNISPAATTTYTLTVTNAAGTTVTATVTVTVVPAPAITSFAAGASTITAGTSTTLTATFSGGTGSVDNSVGAVTSAVAVNITPAVTTTYTLTVTNSLGATATAQSTVTVVAPPAITSFTAGASPITLGNPTTLTAVFTGGTGSVNNGVGAVTSGTPVNVSPTTTTTYTLTVTNAANTSVTAQATVAVNIPPQITSTNGASFTVGALGSFTVRATGTPTPALSETGSLPTGVTFVDNGNGTATLSGTPASGTQTQSPYVFTITAQNGVNPAATQSFTLQVVLTQPPAITSPSSTSFTVSAAGSFTVQATGAPTPALSETGSLPASVIFHDNGNGTATISGTATATGSSTITITAANGIGTNATQSFTLNVVAAPVITSFSAAASPITAGASTTLTAVFSNGTGSVNNGVGAVTNNVAVTVSPASTTTYTLTVTNAAGTSVTSQATVTVVAAPVITSFTAGSTTIVSGTPTTLTPVFNAGAGISASIDNGVGTVTSGTPYSVSPTTTTTYTLTVVNTAGGHVSSSVTITVDVPASITSANNTTFFAGIAGTFTVTTGGSPTPSLSDNGGTLPSGVTFVDNGNGTATLSGTPSSGGSFPLTLTATNGIGSPANQSFTLTVSTVPPSVSISFANPVHFAGGPQETITIKVSSDQSGDTPTASEVVAAVGGVNSGALCTTTTCGTFGTITFVSLSSGTGTYTMAYTPPTSANLTALTTITLTVSSSLSPSFAATANLPVNPTGATVVTVNGPGSAVFNGESAFTLNAKVYNDTTGNPGAQLSLLAAGYTCPSNGSGGTICGTLQVTGANTTGTTPNGVPFTNTPFSYTPPPTSQTSLNEPYDRPMILAVSKGDPAALADANFVIDAGGFIANNTRLSSALTGGAPFTINATIGGDSGGSKTVAWTLTANSSACSPQCGALGIPTYTRNGNSGNPATMTVNTSVTYTPPASVPTGADATPTITMTSVDNVLNGGTAPATDSMAFNIVDGSCGTGSESILSGQYAFLAKGGSATGGYFTTAGSFTADGHGGISGGVLDRNSTTGPVNFAITGGSYSVGSDHRGCLNVTNSNGGTSTYRIALGTLSGSIASQGSITVFTDNTGEGVRASGILIQQAPGAFSTASINGNYVLGLDGVDGSGGRFALAGVSHANGSGTLSNFSIDLDDNGNLDTDDTTGSGTYAITSATGSANGRGTFTYTAPTLGGATLNFAMYVVSSSQFLVIETDPLSPTGNAPIQSGLAKKQSGTFTSTTLDNKDYVLYVSGIDNSNGGSDITLGQSTNATNGAATVTLDENDNGTAQTEQSQALTFDITSNGRTTVPGAGKHPPVFYLIDSTQGFIVGTDGSASSGYMQQQTGTAPLNNSTIASIGQVFFNGSAPTIGGSFDNGSVTVVSASTSITGTDDSSGPSFQCSQGCGGGGLQPNMSITNNGSGPITYSFGTSAVPGQGTLGGMIAYIVSPTEVIFMQPGGTSSNNSSPAELFIVRQ